MGIQRVHFEVDTTASLDALWDTLQDYETWSTWGPWQRSEIERPGRETPSGTGSIRVLAIGRRVLREETTTFEPQREMRYRVLEGIPVRDISQLERDVKQDHPDIAVLTVPADEAQRVLDRVVKTGIKAILNFAPTQLQAPSDVTVKTVNMAMELEGLSYALTNRE